MSSAEAVSVSYAACLDAHYLGDGTLNGEHIARQLIESVRAHRNAEVLRGHVLDQVRHQEPLDGARFPALAVKGISATSQPFRMWLNRQYATHRRSYDPAVLQIDGEMTVLDQTTPERDGANSWHSDSSFMDRPAWGSVLRAVQLRPSVADWHEHLGILYAKQRRFAEAGKHLEAFRHP